MNCCSENETNKLLVVLGNLIYYVCAAFFFCNFFIFLLLKQIYVWNPIYSVVRHFTVLFSFKVISKKGLFSFILFIFCCTIRIRNPFFAVEPINTFFVVVVVFNVFFFFFVCLVIFG